VQVVPWNAPFESLKFDGLFISNGPGDPSDCGPTVGHLTKVLLDKKNVRPVFGICLGHQLLAIAAGAKTFKMK